MNTYDMDVLTCTPAGKARERGTLLGCMPMKYAPMRYTPTRCIPCEMHIPRDARPNKMHAHETHAHGSME